MIGVGTAGLLSGISSAGNILSTLQTNYTNEKIQNSINQMNYQIAQEANAHAAAEAQKNRDWQTEMSNTEVQRRMKDLKAAGINPLLASGGSGATAGSVGNPAVATATMQAHKNLPVEFNLGSISSAMVAADQLQAYAKYADSIGNSANANSLYKTALASKVNILNTAITSAEKQKDYISSQLKKPIDKKTLLEFEKVFGGK